jgi:hypothetical protein
VYEAPEQGIATTMTAAVDITPIENLPRFINRKVLEVVLQCIIHSCS